ncbi:MAG: M15 family metallopeptidase [Candidatus Sumerlaeia bacterium]|nr:M15 family metallopeptidase [Candidatus Sumerlaeia bacterium]
MAKVARAGQVFQAETVEATPFGTEWLRLRSGETGTPLWVPLAYVRRVAPENAMGGDLPIGREQIGPYHGLPLDYCPSDLVLLPARYCFNDEPQRLRAEAAEACRRLLDAAQQESGLRIRVLSAFRSAQTQAYLCRRKISAAGIEQRDVARPGHSEHQLGTAVDLTAANGLHLLNERFGETREGRWLAENCRRFGFVQSYSRARAFREGTPYEPWHFRYVGRLNVERFERTLNER